MSKIASFLAVSSKVIDPHLNSLFSQSAGPVTLPSKSHYSKLREAKVEGRTREDADTKDDEELSEISEELDYEDEDEGNDDTPASPSGKGKTKSDGQKEDMNGTANQRLEEMDTAVDVESRRERKRKRKADNEDLEGKYLAELTKHETLEPTGKRQKGAEETTAMDDEHDSEQLIHESLSASTKSSEAEKAPRTVYLANVSTEAISSKSAKKLLLAHLSSVLDVEASPAQKIESIRFRSVAFNTAAMPKRAAYITKSLMDATTKSTNAYVVFSTEPAARKVVSQLNGTEVLGRHIRVDSVAHPSPTDHRRCVFVGNLGFVDDETVINTNKEGEMERKKRNKIPSDVEEGLWRTFSTQGKVENVRVIRDSKTRVGKGFAYVQFYDANTVETALLLNEKKFPPMLPRKLRVTRAKDPRKTAQAMERSKANANASDNKSRNIVYNPKQTPEQRAAAGRARKLYGRAGAALARRKDAQGLPAGIKAPSEIVLEGRRASSRDALPKDLKGKKGKGKKKGKPINRGTKRAAEWRKKKDSS